MPPPFPRRLGIAAIRASGGALLPPPPPPPSPPPPPPPAPPPPAPAPDSALLVDGLQVLVDEPPILITA